MSDLKPMMVRLSPTLDQRLTEAAEGVMIPKASLARLLIRQQLDSWEEMGQQEEADHISVTRHQSRQERRRAEREARKRRHP
jgi:hypothetical protein